MPPSGRCCLVLVGLPGSGKSTLAALFAEAGWVVVNQDTLGDRKQCEAAASAALAAGRSVVIDRVNFNSMQRRHWIDIAGRHMQQSGRGIQLLALCLDLPAELCLQRALARGDGHATLPASEAPGVIARFQSEWQWPRREEGFDTVVGAKTSEQATTLAQQLVAQLPAAAAAGVEPAVPAGPGAGAPWPAQQRQQHNGWQAQQRQHFVSRADAAGSWRRGGDGGDSAAPQREQSAARPPAAGAPSQGGGGGGEGAGNIVPFPGRRRHGQAQPTHHPDPHKPRRHPWTRHNHDEPSGRLLDAAPSPKPILMFDANGVLTSHTSMRRSSGLHLARPGTPHLRRLLARFRLGLFSSASQRTVDTALALLEEAAGPGEGPLFDRRLVLTRSHTFLAPLAHVAAGGKEWDTVKPLAPYFSRLHRVVLVDDDSHKSCAGEERNMLLMPCWEGHDANDAMVERLVDELLALADVLGDDPEADVRLLTAGASARLAAAAAEQQAARQAAGAPPDVADAVPMDAAPAADAVPVACS